MGILSDPLGFIFGKDEERGVQDLRLKRQPEGERWWQTWENVWGPGGGLDPSAVYPQALGYLDSLMGRYYPAQGGMGQAGPAGGGTWAGPDGQATGRVHPTGVGLLGGAGQDGGAGQRTPSGLPAHLAPAGLSVNLDGQSIPVLTGYDRAMMQLPFMYSDAVSGLMDPWFQAGMELERGRYGSPYYTPGDSGLVGNVLNSAGQTFGKGLGLAGLGAIF